LFDDIEESQGGHFLGSIICINTQKDSHKSADLELVDGQQRMTTITLFYLAIYEYLKNNLPQSDDEDQLMEEKLKLRSLQKKLVLDGGVRLEPSYSNHNLDDYKWIFSSVIKEVKTSTIKPKFLGLRQISRAFNFLSSRLNEVDDNGHPIHSYESVQDLLTKLNSATLVKIDVASHADAFTDCSHLVLMHAFLVIDWDFKFLEKCLMSFIFITNREANVDYEDTEDFSIF
jgi:hypothetical protein